MMKGRLEVPFRITVVRERDFVPPKARPSFALLSPGLPHRFPALLLRLIAKLWYNAVQPATLLDTCNQQSPR